MAVKVMINSGGRAVMVSDDEKVDDRSLTRLFKRIAASQLTGFALVAALLLLWEASARLGWVESRNWPPFSMVVVSSVERVVSGEIPALFASTLALMFTGYVLGSVAGIIFGVVFGLWRVGYWFANPILEILRPIPTPALIPPLILFLGVDDGLKIAIISLATFFPAYINTLSGVRSVDEVLLDTARTFRLGWTARLATIILPSALPSVMSALRINIGMALIVTVIAEMISGASGVGYFIIQTQYAMRPEYVYTAIIGLGLVGYLLNRIAVTVERKLIFWQRDT